MPQQSSHRRFLEKHRDRAVRLQPMGPVLAGGRRVLSIEEFTPEMIEALGQARMDSRHAPLNSLLDA